MSIATLKRKSRHTSPKYPISNGPFSIIGGYRNRGGIGRFQMIGSDNYVCFNDSSVIKKAVVSSSSNTVLHPCCNGYPNEVVKSFIIAGDVDSDSTKGFSANNKDSSTLINAKTLLQGSCNTHATGTDDYNQCANTTKTTQDTPMSYDQYLGKAVSKKIPLCGGSNLPNPVWLNNKCT